MIGRVRTQGPRHSAAIVFVAVSLLTVAYSLSGLTPSASSHSSGPSVIKHIIIIVQENRSFDQFFGTFAGADGIPNGTCVPDTRTRQCIKPYRDPSDRNNSLPHGHEAAQDDINGGAMDGFVQEASGARATDCLLANDPMCTLPESGVEATGYHDQHEIPLYWDYAKQFVLQDRMFEPAPSFTLPAHLYLVSGWSASCDATGDPMSCETNLDSPGQVPGQPKAKNYAWTSITWLLLNNEVSWRYYVAPGTAPDCQDESSAYCVPSKQGAGTESLFNPLPEFSDVRSTGQGGNIQTADNFLTAAQGGTLPDVSWIVPSDTNSDHPDALLSRGQAWVSTLVNAVMSGPDWSSSAIFVVWDDWGGYYDQKNPPTKADLGIPGGADDPGYGIRVPALVISPYAKHGFVDHQVYSFDAYLKFIEDVFLNGQRLDPATDGRPDSRPDVRENYVPGDLTSPIDGPFDFTQNPRAPYILPVYPLPAPGGTGA
jgi:phospholipase C